MIYKGANKEGTMKTLNLKGFERKDNKEEIRPLAYSLKEEVKEGV